MPPDPVPKYVYKIVPSPPPQPIPAEYPLSELDQKDGFVHLSTATQIPNTANLFYNEASSLWVIKMELERFAESTKWENEFPHLYGNFGADDVLSVEKFQRGEAQKWPESMQGSSWLE